MTPHRRSIRYSLHSLNHNLLLLPQKSRWPTPWNINWLRRSESCSREHGAQWKAARALPIARSVLRRQSTPIRNLLTFKTSRRQRKSPNREIYILAISSWDTRNAVAWMLTSHPVQVRSGQEMKFLIAMKLVFTATTMSNHLSVSWRLSLTILARLRNLLKWPLMAIQSSADRTHAKSKQWSNLWWKRVIIGLRCQWWTSKTMRWIWGLWRTGSFPTMSAI